MRKVCVYLHVGALAAFRWWQKVSTHASEKEGQKAGRPHGAPMLLLGCKVARSGKPLIIIDLYKSKHCN